MKKIEQEILQTVAGIDEAPEGAYNIRVDGASIGRRSTDTIQIDPREDGRGLTVTVAPGTKRDHVHIPVVIGKSGVSEVVYNDFYIGAGADEIGRAHV